MRRVLCGAAVATAACVAALLSAQTAVAHRAVGVRLGDHPGFVRVVVDFVQGPVRFNEVESTDPFPFDGAARLRVDSPGITTQASPRTALGVSVSITQGTNQIFVRINTQPRRFKYVSYFVLTGPDRLVIDLWKAAPPVPAAEIRRAPDRCLTLDTFSVAGARVRATGTERNLFERSLVVRVRGSDGRLVAEKPEIGPNWSTNFPYRVTRVQPGTLEAVALSAKDGALDCIVQVRVTLRP
jgi:hypothetical protein